MTPPSPTGDIATAMPWMATTVIIGEIVPLSSTDRAQGISTPRIPARFHASTIISTASRIWVSDISLDFLNHGSQEADSWYDPNVTTGIQAYNVGMKHIAERCGDDFFIDLSISPLFPAQHANARRISCDAWGEMWHTNYMMNSLSFGWWLDRVYTFNDPDHICMNIQTDEENMQRMTSAVCTGFCMLGDNLSTEGSYPGFQMAFDKA